MKHATNIAGGLLGLLFITFAMMYFLKMGPPQEAPPEGSPKAMFMGALFPTGYFDFVKVLELVGGLLVAIPKTRNLGLLVLGPIIINIIAFHTFITNNPAEMLLPPIIPMIVALTLFLLWSGRKAFCGLLN